MATTDGEDTMVTLRPVRLPDDRAHILAFDRSFTADRIYRIVQSPESFALAAVAVQPPLRKEMPLAEYLGDDRMWAEGLVAADGDTIVGFAAYTHHVWNRRTELWHLYVDAARRGEGIGRMLVEAVIAEAQAAGTRCIWLETSNVAYPAIQFYRRMGFHFCGLDTSLYDPTGAGGGETALYFAYPLPEIPADASRD
jgi:ribosomal protein S18 acetylase RimI-like enzyme